jgi:CheY-like chemotaxis protein
MRILFLDDMETRHRRFANWAVGHDVVHVWSSDAAIAALSGQRFDVAFLDHDLKDEHYLELSEGLSEDPPAGHDPSARLSGTGMDVVDHIVGMRIDHQPGFVVVHSFNTPRAEEMVLRLADGDVASIHVPFSEGITKWLYKGGT